MRLRAGTRVDLSGFQIILERLIAGGERLVADAEVLQEILHRYTAINRREAISPALQATLEIVDDVMPI